MGEWTDPLPGAPPRGQGSLPHGCWAPRKESQNTQQLSASRSLPWTSASFPWNSVGDKQATTI